VTVASIRYRVHALIQMEERDISPADVRMALESGEDIEDRPADQPYPSRLVLGLSSTGALHVAVYDIIEADEVWVTTVYRPDPALWEPDMKTRKARRS